MRSLGTRRVALLAGAATVAAVALAGCSAGQVAETSLKRPSNQGVNTQNTTGSVLIRNLAVSYNGPAGYQPGANAPIEVNLYQTANAITVVVASAPAASGAPATGVVSQGTHPEPVDTSALGWVMDGADVVPPEYGYFLGRTWRMHPAVAGPARVGPAGRERRGVIRGNVRPPR